MPAERSSRTWISLKTPLAADLLHPVAFHGIEAISQPFSFEVEMAAHLDADVPFDALTGKTMSVTLAAPSGATRHFHGIVHDLEQLDDDDEFQHFTARLVPEFYLLTKTTQYRIFQHLTVPEILKTVLKDVRYVSMKDLKEKYPVHNYCVQYDESNFDFACRLMEEEGIYYYFVHDEANCRLMLADRSTNSPSIAEPATLRFDSVVGGVRDDFRVHQWTKRQRIRTRQATVRDYHFQRPSQTLEAAATNPGDIPAGAAVHSTAADVGEYYLPSVGFAHRQDGISSGGAPQFGSLDVLAQDNVRHATLVMQREAALSLEIEGASNAWNLRPGFKFTLTRHGMGDGGYVVTSVRHEARQTPPRSTAETTLDRYQNSFLAIPETLPFRPQANTPVPFAAMQTATVVGPPGEPIYTDPFARIKAQFHWDREHSFDADSSCWMRPIQPMAGKKYGFHTIPRIGHEALIEFQHGDPDQPIIWGGLHNPDQMPPFPLPGNRTQTGFKSHSMSGDSPNFSGFAIEARDGAEMIQLHSEKDMQFSVANTHYNNTGGSLFENYSRGRTQIVGGLPFTNSALPSGASGDGGGDPIDSKTHPSYGEWTTGVSPYPWAQDMDLVMGHKLEGLIGLYFEPTYGCHTATVINPFGVLAALGVPATVAGMAFPYGILGKAVASQGNCAAVFGTSCAPIYGPAYKISRGPIMDHTYAKPGAMTTGIKLAAFAYFLVCCSQLLARLFENDDDGDAIDLGLAALQELVFSIWFGLEIGFFYTLQLGEKTVKRTELIAKLTAMQGWAGFLAADSVLAQATQMEAQIVAGVGDAARSSGLEELSNVDGVPANMVSDSRHVLQAQAIELVSNPAPENLGAGISFESYGYLDEGGNIAISAVSSIHAQVGTSTYVDMAGGVPAIKVDPGEGGIVLIRSGAEEEVPMIMLGPPGVLMVSDVELLLTGAESIIDMVAEALTLEMSSGASSLTLTAASITFNSPAINVTGDGIKAKSTPVFSIETAVASFEASTLR